MRTLAIPQPGEPPWLALLREDAQRLKAGLPLRNTERGHDGWQKGWRHTAQARANMANAARARWQRRKGTA